MPADGLIEKKYICPQMAIIEENGKMWDIYYIYWVSSGYIQQYSRLDQGFFVLCVIPRAARRALGIRHRTKKPWSRGYIVLYSPPRPNIYITYICAERFSRRFNFFNKFEKLSTIFIFQI